MKKIRSFFKNKWSSFSTGMILMLSGANAQNQAQSPFDTSKFLPSDAGTTFPEQVAWVISWGMKIFLIFVILALVGAGIWVLYGGLEQGKNKGEWGNFFMGLIMVVIAIVMAAVLATTGWDWISAIGS